MLWAQPAFATGGLDLNGDGDDDDGPRDRPRERPASGDGPAQAVVGGLAVRVRIGGAESARYRGTIADIGSTRINTVALEEYLLGVVPEEMPSAWPQAALEAQAIVARTYALRKRNPAKSYDLVAGTADQMYGGINAESPAATSAITSTNGMIVTYGNATADVAYMACCGGHTADSQLIWGSDIPYLHGVIDPYCAAAPDSTWSVSMDWDAVARSLHLDANGQLENVQLIGSPGARPTGLRFVADGTSQDVSVFDLRRGYTGSMPSTYIRNVAVQREGDDDAKLLVTGAGRGHGVGFCQWGARGLALAGANAAQIVGFYFPGTGIGQVPSIT